MRVEGVKLTCSRCGKEQFHPWKMIHSKYPDEKPADWLTVDKEDAIHLCPTCAEKYSTMMSHFLNTKEEKPI